MGVGHWEWWIRHWESWMVEGRDAEVVSGIWMAMGMGTVGWGLFGGNKEKGYAMEERVPAKVAERQGRLTNILSTSAHVSSSKPMSIGPTPCPVPLPPPMRPFCILFAPSLRLLCLLLASFLRLLCVNFASVLRPLCLLFAFSLNTLCVLSISSCILFASSLRRLCILVWSSFLGFYAGFASYVRCFCIFLAFLCVPFASSLKSSLRSPCILSAPSWRPPCVLFAVPLDPPSPPLCILFASSLRPHCVLIAPTPYNRWNNLNEKVEISTPESNIHVVSSQFAWASTPGRWDNKDISNILWTRAAQDVLDGSEIMLGIFTSCKRPETFFDILDKACDIFLTS